MRVSHPSISLQLDRQVVPVCVRLSLRHSSLARGLQTPVFWKALKGLGLQVE